MALFWDSLSKPACSEKHTTLCAQLWQLFLFADLKVLYNSQSVWPPCFRRSTEVKWHLSELKHSGTIGHHIWRPLERLHRCFTEMRSVCHLLNFPDRFLSIGKYWEVYLLQKRQKLFHFATYRSKLKSFCLFVIYIDILQYRSPYSSCYMRLRFPALPVVMLIEWQYQKSHLHCEGSLP